MSNQDEDDLKEILERPAPGERWIPEALHDLGVDQPGKCMIEANGYANIIMFISCLSPEHRLLMGHIAKEARIGLVFVEMHNQGKRPMWHEARAEFERRNGHV